jgi:uncharacterized phage protein (TIGR01671 family)
MSALKFRAWEEQRKKFHYFSGIFNSQPYIEHSIFAQYESSPEYPLLVTEQFTGLTDNNDQDIYKGDICRAWWYHVSESYGGSGQWIGEITISPNKGMVLINAICMDWITIIEVIGNIHENPELLK